MLNEEFAKYRLESLKLSYEFTLNIIKMNVVFDKGKTVDVTDFIKDVFTLTDINFDYIINATTPSYEGEDDGVDEIETI